MKNFVLYSALEEPHNITKDEFEKYTKNEYPFRIEKHNKNLIIR